MPNERVTPPQAKEFKIYRKAHLHYPDAPVKPLSSGLKRATKRFFKRADYKVLTPKIVEHRAEYRYAQPPNIGNARNPLVFGRIPLEYQIREQIENERVMHDASLTGDMRAYRARVQAMNYPRNEVNPMKLKK
jgi:hypothetical protein